jgi:2,3-bisphosphoglycerate-independent phosphoglycerate mutase
MKSFTAGQIPSAEAKELLKDFEDYLGQDELRFVPGVSYRNLLIADGSKKSIELSTIETSCTAPHDLTGKSISEGLPAGPGAEFLSAIMDASRKFFANHHVNVNRIKQGQLPATQVWLWGIGKRPRLDSFERKFGVRGSMITAVDLLRGLGHLLGWRIVEVPGATGYLDTDYAAKGRYAIEALGEADLVCVHIEAPDEASHEGDCENKIHSLEQIDRLIAAPLMEHLSTQPAWRILLSPDHPTFIRTQTHSRGFVPFTICGTGVGPDSHARYDEETASQSDLVFAKGHELMPRFINPTDSLEPKTES